MEDYMNALWATARQVTKKKRCKVVTKHDVMSVLYKRSEYYGAVFSNHVPIHCSLLMENYLKDSCANARRVPKDNRCKVVTKILAQSEYYGVDLSNQVPIHCSLLKEDYLKDLWANARLVTQKDRRKVVTKYDIMSVLYKRAEYQGAVLSNQVPIHCIYL
ncbi:hypothetical protein CDAR_559091 [Caerostris darwini]|uniref:Uncharacterized protein n=1 Tax=Caerostris darwini TaxID=1538125 RepID=A0AAV4P0I1_9ARAC|nr:hypothetical protein CDAR_559091 [Caerostris darwini]